MYVDITHFFCSFTVADNVELFYFPRQSEPRVSPLYVCSMTGPLLVFLFIRNLDVPEYVIPLPQIVLQVCIIFSSFVTKAASYDCESHDCAVSNVKSLIVMDGMGWGGMV